MQDSIKDNNEWFLARIAPDRGGYLGELRAFAEKEGVPIFGEEVENFLRFFLPVLCPSRILELGTAIGYSASVMAAVLLEATITTVEIDPDRAVSARTHFQNQDLESRIRLVVEDAEAFMRNDEGIYDFIFVDAAKGQYEKYLKRALALLAPGGVIAMDNVLFHGMLASKELYVRRKVTIVKRLKRMLYDILREEGIVADILPIDDGLLLIRREYE